MSCPSDVVASFGHAVRMLRTMAVQSPSSIGCWLGLRLHPSPDPLWCGAVFPQPVRSSAQRMASSVACGDRDGTATAF